MPPQAEAAIARGSLGGDPPHPQSTDPEHVNTRGDETMNPKTAGRYVSPKAVRWLWTLAVLGGASTLSSARQPAAAALAQPAPRGVPFRGVRSGRPAADRISRPDRRPRWNALRLHSRGHGRHASVGGPGDGRDSRRRRFSSYPWSRTGALTEETAWFKRWWLEPGFFTARLVAYLAIWAVFAAAMVRASRRTALGGPTRAGARLSAAFS